MARFDQAMRRLMCALSTGYWNLASLQNLKMEGFIAPPAFTTVRFDPNRVEPAVAIELLEDVVKKDINYRKVPHRHKASDWHVESHPVLRDVLLVPTKLLENVEPEPDEVIVDRLCGMAILRGAHVFAPGVIAAPQYMKVGDSVAVYSDMEGKCLKGAIAKYNGKKHFIGNGVAEVSRDDLFTGSSRKTRGIGIRMAEPLYLAPSFNQDSLPDSFFLQNLPSIVAGHVLDPKPGDMVLDMCAAPGGKSTHICSLLCGSGRVIALDRSRKKVEKIEENAKRLGYSSLLHSFDVDSRHIIAEDKPTGADLNPDFSPPFPPQSFTKILLDAPCSALGQRPRFPTQVKDNESALASYPKLQWQLFKTAVSLLKPGGTLVYSTCTTTHKENEGLVEQALKEYEDLILAPQVPHLGCTGRREHSRLSEDKLNLLQYFPMKAIERVVGHPVDGDTIGFFIAKFIKVLK